MRGRLEILKPERIIYQTKIGPYNDFNHEAMTAIRQFANENELGDSVFYGIIHDNVAITPAEECRYDACVAIAEEFVIPESSSFQEGKVQGGKYIAVDVEDNKPAIERAWIEIFPEVMKKGYSIDMSRKIIERYSTNKQEKNCYELLIPVQ